MATETLNIRTFFALFLDREGINQPSIGSTFEAFAEKSIVDAHVDSVRTVVLPPNATDGAGLVKVWEAADTNGFEMLVGWIDAGHGFFEVSAKIRRVTSATDMTPVTSDGWTVPYESAFSLSCDFAFAFTSQVVRVSRVKSVMGTFDGNGKPKRLIDPSADIANGQIYELWVLNTDTTKSRVFKYVVLHK